MSNLEFIRWIVFFSIPRPFLNLNPGNFLKHQMEATDDSKFSWTTTGDYFLSQSVDRCVVYKLVGTQTTIAEYNAAHSQHPPGSFSASGLSSEAKTSSAVNHWSALYTQVTADHAEGTAGYRWDQGYPYANLLELKLQPDILLGVCSGPIWSDGSVPSTKKAELALRLMSQVPLPASITVKEPEPSAVEPGKTVELMGYLGSFPSPVCLLVPETPAELEIIIPHSMVRVAVVGEKVVRRIERPRWAGPATKE